MKRGFSRSLISTAFAALCFFLLMTGSAQAADSPTSAHVFYVTSDTWSSSLLASNASSGATLELSNCPVGPVPTARLEGNGSALVDNITRFQCNANALFGVVDLRQTGSIDVGTEATYRDARGNTNFVYIPAFTEAQKLPAGFDTATSAARLTMSRVSNVDGKRSTYLAIVGAGYLTATIYDAKNDEIAREPIDATSGATFYRLRTQVAIGRAVITRGASGTCRVWPCEFGDRTTTDMYVIGFVGKDEGGSPRVELPRLSISTVAP